ncbi:hypothetical protein ABZ543_33770 [Streptomyces roseifaciens]
MGVFRGRMYRLGQLADELGLTADDREAVECPFGRLVWDLDDALSLPAVTDTQRAVLEHLKAGRHWSRPGAGHPMFEY